MSLRRPLLLLCLAFLWAPAGRAGERTEAPRLRIYSRLGVKSVVKLFNDEAISFLARSADDPTAAPQRGVIFVLYERPGSADRSEDVIARTEDDRYWGRPPSSLALPLSQKTLEPGAYNLRAKKPGFTSDRIVVEIARFAYFDLTSERTKDRYFASFRLRLTDPTLKIDLLKVTLHTVAASGVRIDGHEHRLRRVKSSSVFESLCPVELSSRAPRPEADGGEDPTRALLVRPGSRFVVRLGDYRFSWPVPLPPEKNRQSGNKRGLGR